MTESQIRAADDALVDAYVRTAFPGHFAPEDESPGASALRGEQPEEPSEDEQFERYMRTHFPGRA